MKYLIVIIVCLLIGGLFGFYIKPSPKDAYWNKPGFKTDTIRKHEYRMDTGGKKALVIPPKIVYLHDQAPAPQNNFTPKIIHDTLRLHDTVTGKIINLPPCYLNSYIAQPRIIAGRFTKTGISIDLWDTTCKVITKVYPTNWEQFDYFWNGEEIKADAVQAHTIPKIGSAKRRFTTASSFYITEEVLTKAPYISADYSFNFNRVGVYTMGSVGYNSDLTAHLYIGVRLKLK